MRAEPLTKELRHLGILATLLSLSALPSCGGDSEKDPGLSPETGGSGGEAGNAGGGGALAGGTGGGAAGSGGQPDDPRGEVFVVQHQSLVEGLIKPKWRAGASFARAGWIASTPVGSCEKLLEQAESPTLASAGKISITGGKVPVELTFDDAFKTEVDSTLFDGGEALTVSAEGAEVPAFQGTVQAPKVLTVTQPSFDSLPFQSSQPLTLSWQPAPGTVYLELVQAIVVFCKFNGEDGNGTVPAEVTSLFQPGMSAQMAVATITETWLQAGDFKVRLLAMQGARRPDGKPATASGTVP